MISFNEHILTRLGKFSVYENRSFYVDYINEKLAFLIFSPTQQLVGFQQYYWKGSKKQNNLETGKYYSYYTKGFNFVPWGYEFYVPGKPIVVVEGIFDAISVINAGYNAFAILSKADFSKLQMINLLPETKMLLTDGDKKTFESFTIKNGNKLIKQNCIFDKIACCPEGKDPNLLTINEIRDLIDNATAVDKFIRDENDLYAN
jgi:DNA primase